MFCDNFHSQNVIFAGLDGSKSVRSSRHRRGYDAGPLCRPRGRLGADEHSNKVATVPDDRAAEQVRRANGDAEIHSGNIERCRCKCFYKPPLPHFPVAFIGYRRCSWTLSP